ncbi:YqeB family protein [Micromonospora sp. NBC_00421]|uniref:YqeB family protein n=1 Tax=Micromonospora sp. NBC_00421 TaxID=2975976 RepID=UPI002E234BC8
MRAREPGAATRVGGDVGELVVLWVGFPLLGAAVGGLLPLVADWVAGLPWAPVQGWFELVAGLPYRRALVGGVLLGVLAGLLVAHVGTRERLIVTVDRGGARLRRDGVDRDLPRGSVTAVFTDGRELVLLGPAGAELARERSDLSRRRLRDAFREHGWSWQDADPHREAYRRWVAGLPDLPPGADPLLCARQRAVDADRQRDARELRGELARLGVVVRDEDKRQYWRTVPLPREEKPDGR